VSVIDPQRVIDCRDCPRLVAWREEVAETKRAAFQDETYWGRPVPGFGDPGARIVILGLAPAAHGANRTGRVFTGDRTGDFLFAALYRTGFGNQPQSVSRDDGLMIRDAWLTAAVRCAPPANKPTPQERDTCQRWTVAELERMRDVRVVICLGAFAWDAALRLRTALGAATVSPKPKFGHGALFETEPWALLGSFHPSQQNTFTGKLTEAMLDEVLLQAREIADLSNSSWP
jgi:uracil-DNA glycosylase family 4